MVIPLYERIKSVIQDLQTSYSFGVSELIREAHDRVIREGLDLLIESDALFNDNETLTSEWSDIGTEGAAAILKSVELAERYDPHENIVPKIERTYLLNIAAMENYRCGRHGITSAVIKSKLSAVPDEYLNTPTGMLLNILRSFCSGDLEKTWGLCKNYRTNIINELSNITELDPALKSSRMQLLLSLTNVVKILLVIKAHLESGEKFPEDTDKWLGNSVKFCQNAGDMEYQIFLESFIRAFHGLKKLSIWNLKESGIKGENTLFYAWAKHRISSGKPFLFPTQYEVLISRNSMSKDSSLIAMPTGGGKTLISEFHILKSLSELPSEKCLLVVPTRALASEKRQELELAFSWESSPISVCQMTGELAVDAESALKTNNVIVLTPEKFDIIMRNNFFDQSIASLVVDEFHQIKASYRGIKLQLAIKRFQETHSSRILYISAIVREPDLKDVSKWARTSDPFSTEWRPTPSRIGIISINQQTPAVSFNDGTFRMIENMDRVKKGAINDASIQIVKTFIETENDQVLHFNLSWRGFRQGENRLIELAEKYMKALEGDVTFEPRKLREYATIFSRLAGYEDPISKAFSKGIALHWSELPHLARNIVEKAIRDRAIGLILSTSTLAEGVNLPIKTVFIPKLSTRRKAMDKGTFLNIIGRAGRPYFHPEGQVIIAVNESGPYSDQTSRATANEYASTTGSDIEPMITSIVDTAECIEEMEGDTTIWESGEPEPRFDWESNVKDLNRLDEYKRALAEVEALSSSLLACLVEGLVKDLDFETLESVIFLGPETPQQRKSVQKLLNLVEDRMYHYEVMNEEKGSTNVTLWGKTVYKTGLGPQSCHLLRTYISNFFDEFNKLKINGNVISRRGSISNSFTIKMLKTIHIPLEHYVFGDGTFTSTDENLLLQWISGKPTEEIAKFDPALKNNFLKTYTKLDGVLSGFAAWIFNSAYLIALFEKGSTPGVRSIQLLGRFVLYGHHERYLLELLEKDVNRTLLRDDVISLFSNLKNFKGLLEGKYNSKDLEDILYQGAIHTRINERDIIKALLELTKNR